MAQVSKSTSSTSAVDPQRFIGRSYQMAVLCLGLAALIFFGVLNSPSSISTSEEGHKLTAMLEEKSGAEMAAKSAQESVKTVQNVNGPVHILSDQSNNIPFYYCHTEGTDPSPESESARSLILLHGAKFTREDWKAAPQNLLQKFCSSPTQHSLHVYAVDLPQNTHGYLQAFLVAMTQSHNLQTPVSLVTPSASGVTMVGWLSDDRASSTIPQFVRQWIPVAALSVIAANEADLGKLNQLYRIPVLAIYGDQDPQGRICSNKLHMVADAKVVELEGTHPCYLDSPVDFVETVVLFVDS
jgi:hypothetical protein